MLFGGRGSAETDAFAEHFTEAQDKAPRELLGSLQARFGAVSITAHNEYAARACPAFNVAHGRLRWRLAEIHDMASDALDGR